MVEKKYALLRTIRMILLIMTGLIFVFSLICGINVSGVWSQREQRPADTPPGVKPISTSTTMGIMIIIGGMIGAIGLWAWAELIKRKMTLLTSAINSVNHGR